MSSLQSHDKYTQITFITNFQSIDCNIERSIELKSNKYFQENDFLKNQLGYNGNYKTLFMTKFT